MEISRTIAKLQLFNIMAITLTEFSRPSTFQRIIITYATDWLGIPGNFAGNVTLVKYGLSLSRDWLLQQPIRARHQIFGNIVLLTAWSQGFKNHI